MSILEMKLSNTAKTIINNCNDKEKAEIIILYFSGNFSAFCLENDLKLDAKAMNSFINEVSKDIHTNVNVFTVANNIDYVINNPYRIAVY